MEEILESPPAEHVQDKKNYATNDGAKKSISANNSNENCITIESEKQNRIDEAERFFNLLYDKITDSHFSYLMTFSNGYGVTYSFAISDETQRIAMARKAIELNDKGFEIWHAVNIVSIEPKDGKRGDETVVSYQTACVVDIDIQSDAHKSNNLAKSFDEAKSFLPFTPSIIINSGYGLHAYYIWEEPLTITDQNREEIKHRNNLLIEVVRQKANGKKIDGVGDLPRILRTPGTFNYKLGKDNAPLCQIIEINDVRYSTAEIDARLKALYLETKQIAEPALKSYIDYADDNPDLKEFRIRRMLDYINVVDGEYEKWLSVGMALKNEGLDCSLWENWSRTQPEFKEGECESKWQGFNRTGYGIGTLYQYAVENGYDEKETRNEWFQLHLELSEKKTSSKQSDSLKTELCSVNKALADFDAEKNSAIERVKNIDTFDSETTFSEDILTATAFARLFDKKVFSDFKGKITLYNRQNTEKRTSVIDWLTDVKNKAEEISSRQDNLLARRNEIQAQINSLSFIEANDLLQGLSIPDGYSMSAQDGIIKVDGKKIVQVCRRPIAVTGKTFSVEEKIFKLTLAYKTANDEWKTMPAVEAATVFNNRKIVDLANGGLPVTSSNATRLVDFLDAFHAQNENNFPLTYSVSRCGWHNFNGTEQFIDPRFSCTLDVKNKKIGVKVESQSQFANSLRTGGKFGQWKKAYKLAKKSPVARLVVAASVAPPLLKILGERNFLLYIYAPTRAGKTTALYLGASAVGSEKMIRSFDATKNGLAGAAADVNDYVFLVDEKQVADSKVKEQLDTLVYALANGLGRTKLNKDSTLKKTTDWRTIPIMTGETLLLPDNVTGGANTRLLTISTSKVILDADTCKQIRNSIADNYGHAFPLVINKILAIGKETLRKVYNTIVDTFTEKYPDILDEYRRYMAVITLADALLNSVLAEDTQEGLPLLLENAILNAREIFKLLPTTAEISDTVRERDFVLSLIAQNQNRFIGGNVELDRMQAIWGKLNDPDGYTYISAKALQDECNRSGYDYHKLVDNLVTDGFFVPADTTEKGRKKPLATVNKKLGKASTRCYRISTKTLNADE